MQPEDYDREWLSLDCSVRVVDSLDDALQHIEEHGSGHSEAIVTNSYAASQRFLAEADAAAVYVNASTQFTDGAQFGLGARVRHLHPEDARARPDGAARADLVQVDDPRRRPDPPALATLATCAG